MIYHRIAARMFNTPLLIHPGKMSAVLTGIGARVTGAGQLLINSGFAPVQHRAGTIADRLGRAVERANAKPYDVVSGVAVIAIEGSLIHKGAFLDSDSGETSYEGLQTQVAAAMRDDAVRAVAFEVDSFGGEEAGAYETADMIAALGKIKPTIAILSDFAYSAGYLLASAARQVILPDMGGAGSIGVVAVHTDTSAALDMEGLAVTIMTAGSHKADGNPFEPLADDVRGEIVAELEKSRRHFANRVAEYRGTRLTFDAVMATEARTFTGEDAVRLGLADAVGHPSDAFAAFVAAVNRQ